MSFTALSLEPCDAEGDGSAHFSAAQTTPDAEEGGRGQHHPAPAGALMLLRRSLSTLRAIALSLTLVMLLKSAHLELKEGARLTDNIHPLT